MNPTHSIRSRRPFAAALLLGFFAASCGGSATPAEHTDAGYSALNKGDAKGAQAEFDQALAALKSTDAGYLRAKMGSIEALIETNTEASTAKAKDEFIALAAGMSSQVKSSDYINVSSKLANKQRFGDAIKVLEAGLKAHAEDPKVKAVGEKIKELASKAGDNEALKALSGLGYL